LSRWWCDGATRAGGGRRNNRVRSKEGVTVTVAAAGVKRAKSRHKVTYVVLVPRDLQKMVIRYHRGLRTC